MSELVAKAKLFIVFRLVLIKYSLFPTHQLLSQEQLRLRSTASTCQGMLAGTGGRTHRSWESWSRWPEPRPCLLRWALARTGNGKRNSRPGSFHRTQSVYTCLPPRSPWSTPQMEDVGESSTVPALLGMNSSPRTGLLSSSSNQGTWCRKNRSAPTLASGTCPRWKRLWQIIRTENEGASWSESTVGLQHTGSHNPSVPVKLVITLRKF